ncbi:L-xylulose reductase [Orchesella cincta]|uniref:L-xylulose reductase n=1 Tax=Orchesella cincta TaxID=48709 RepID=A0A1D2M5D9_ORCCI|nr:L-xylulose reductase [Orchesella cincta]
MNKFKIKYVIKIFFAGKRILVTGGGQGIGRQLVQRFHDDKALVFVIDNNRETIDQLCKELPKVTAILADLADWDATRKAIQSFGVLDHVVNNAAMAKPQMLMDVTKESAKLKMIDVGSGGTFVNVCSLGCKGAVPFTSMYCASKAALEMLTKSMAVELGPHNIRANCIAPGFVETPIHKSLDPAMKNQLLSRNIIKRAIDSNEVADLVMFLLSPLSAMITGETVVC